MTDPLTERQGAAILADPATAELLAYADAVEAGEVDDPSLSTPEEVAAFFHARRP